MASQSGVTGPKGRQSDAGKLSLDAQRLQPQERNREVQEELDKLQERIRELEEEPKKLQERIRELEEEPDKLQERNRELQEELDKSNAETDKSNAETARLRIQVRELSEQIRLHLERSRKLRKSLENFLQRAPDVQRGSVSKTKVRQAFGAFADVVKEVREWLREL